MNFTIHVERNDAASDEPAVIGWTYTQTTAQVLYDPPTRLNTGGDRSHAKSASRCPAVRDMESRYFVINSPVDIDIGFARDANGDPAFINRKGKASTATTGVLDQLLEMMPEDTWRHADRPTVQLRLPYLFVADEPVYLTQVAPFAHYREPQLPGTVFGGRFPIDVWPRPLLWAFEWHDTERPIVVERGEPLFYVHFECSSPERTLKLVPAALTDELREYMEKLAGVAGYVNQTFGLFEAAERLRPTRLVEPLPRS